MPTHLHDHHGPPRGPGYPHHGPGPVHRLYSAEKKLPLRDVSRILARFAASLAKAGRIHLRDDLEISPPDPCETMIRFERTPVGHLILKVELKWGDEDPLTDRGDAMDDLLGDNGREEPALDSDAETAGGPR
jgi:hypothetical protein